MNQLSRKGSTIKDFPTKMSIPDTEEIISSNKWLRKYNLNQLHLVFHSVIATGKCCHDCNQNKAPTLIDTRFVLIFIFTYIANKNQ